MTLRIFRVRGTGSFPFEMLHKAQCFPASLADAEKIALSCPTVAPEQTIALASSSSKGLFSLAEWEAHKWRVVRIDA
jgi:hypothetical protein